MALLLERPRVLQLFPLRREQTPILSSLLPGRVISSPFLAASFLCSLQLCLLLVAFAESRALCPLHLSTLCFGVERTASPRRRSLGLGVAHFLPWSPFSAVDGPGCHFLKADPSVYRDDWILCFYRFVFILTDTTLSLMCLASGLVWEHL